jgi:hypothetical protein
VHWNAECECDVQWITKRNFELCANTVIESCVLSTVSKVSAISAKIDTKPKQIVTGCVASHQLSLTFQDGPDSNTNGNFLQMRSSITLTLVKVLLRNLVDASINASFFVQARQMQIPYYGAIARSLRTHTSECTRIML